ncbi:deleted in malignant brain tumors 1 protein-like [Pomacea canaliculata]|uniref:deleted in malignant brain tumors 1 protein-like n=1 Tax=Pomacea canaliculata TaxID=400727 RepID=UPI000D72CA89|nr:deleted in malignant brain tumors 1 protein-like [Pomacea canaliculata]
MSILLDEVDCQGDETNIFQCGFAPIGTTDCGHSEDVGVLCQGPTTSATSLKARLVNGSSTSEGRLEVFYNGSWSTVCTHGFGQKEAQVACRMLGFNSPGVTVMPPSFYGPGQGSILLDDVRCSGSETNLQQCGNKGYYNHDCTHRDDVGIICNPIPVAFRLSGVHRTRFDRGRLEIRVNGNWGTVCDDYFNNNAAKVVCRQLRYPSYAAMAVYGAPFGQGQGPILLDNVRCLGNESSLMNCLHDPIGVSNCDHSEDVGIICSDVTPASGNMTARLVGGNATEGRLEVNFNNQWGTVCDDYFSDVDAQVVCAMLGITGGLPRMLPIGTYPPGTGIIWMDDVDCVGNETNLDACKHRQLGTNNCDHSEDVAVACGPMIPTITQIRLVGGDDHQGRVEIQHNGFWGTLCDDSWGIKEARVTCNQLGLTNVVPVPMANAYYGQGSGQIWLDEVDCLGNETNLDKCRHKPFGYNDCDHSEDAGLLCMTPPTSPAPFVVRLSGGASMYEGRVEVRYNNYWGTVCDDNFEPVDAQIVCRTLGYSGGRILTHVGAGRGPIWMDDLGCTGSEATLDQCPFNGWGEHDCDHKEDVGVSCENPGEMDLPVRLANGGGPDSGRVEVEYNGRWGTVCDTNFDNNVAAVICRQLGYSTATAQAFGGSHFGAAPDEYIAWVSGIQCVGAEPWIGQCNISMNTGACDNTHTAGVACNGGPLPAINVRLVGGGNSQEGRVEISFNGTWGTVCDDYWDHDDAVVICRMLGLPTNNVIPRGGGYFISGTRPTKIWLDDLKCLGSETSIAQCPHAGWGKSNCLHSEDAGVVCGGSVPMSPIRLVGGLTTHEGRVEIFYNNTWGTVCDDFFGTEEATVVCRTLGFQTQGAVAFPRGRYGAGTGTIWLDDVSCAGSEQYLDMCAYRPWGHSNCAHREDVSVSCGGVPTSAMIRLVGSSNNSAGRVEMKVNGTWGTVCSDLWNTMDAMVVCGMLGFSRTGSQAVVSSQFGHGSGPIWLDDVQCTGYEESLLNCRSKPLGQTNCDHTQDAGVICSGTPLQIRLTPGPSQGFLEVQINATWGSVCDSGLEGAPGQAVARVVCRQLNQPFSGAYSVTHGRLGQGSGPVVLDALSCTGQENFLGQCRHNPAGAVLCQPSQTLGIVCAAATTTTVTTPPSTTPAPVIDYITLGGNFTAYSGRVDVYHNGMWGTVCNHNWTNQDASVVCKMLGYSGQNATALVNSQVYGAGTGIIWLDNVKCDGTETNIGACHSWNWGTTNCVHSQDVGVACAPGQLPNNFLLFTETTKNGSNIIRMDMTSYSYITIPLPGLGRPFAIDYDYINSKMYWTDLATKQIRSARVDGTQNRTVLALGANSDAEGLAVDPVSGLLFYTDTGSNIIALVTLVGFQRKVVISTDLQQPRPIVLDVMNGIMFWADWGSNPKIERANYDGTSRQAIITSDLTWPNALALDIPNQQIFWVDSSDSYDDKVEYSDLFGDNRMAIYSEPRTHFVGMALYNGHIYLSDWQSRSLKHLQTDGTYVMNVGTPTFGYINDVLVHVDGADPQGPNGCTQNTEL